jgi:hypothetical protein
MQRRADSGPGSGIAALPMYKRHMIDVHEVSDAPLITDQEASILRRQRADERGVHL